MDWRAPAPLVAPLLGQAALEPVLLRRGQPAGLGRAVGQPEQGDDAEHDGGQRLDDEQPLPPVQAADARHAVQDQAGHGGAQEGGNGDRQHEPADDLGAVLAREPVGEIQDHAGEEPGLRHAEQHAQGVERPHAGDQRHRGGDDPPGHHDAGDPAPGAEALQQQVAGHLEDEIRQEEQPGPEAEHGGRQVQVLADVVAGEAQVHPVHERHEVAHHEERHDAQADPADGGAFEGDVVHCGVSVI